MEFNQTPPALPPHHVHPSLKFVMLVFAVILIGALGYLVYDQRTAPDATDYSAPSVKKNTEQAAETPTDKTTTTTDETANWKTYNNNLYGFGFKFPSGYGEVKLTLSDFVANQTPAAKGKEIDLTFSTNSFLDGGAITKDFEANRGAASYEVRSLTYTNGSCTVNTRPAVRCELVKNANKTDSYLMQVESFGEQELLAVSKLGTSSEFLFLSFRHKKTDSATRAELKNILTTFSVK